MSYLNENGYYRRIVGREVEEVWISGLFSGKSNS